MLRRMFECAFVVCLFLSMVCTGVGAARHAVSDPPAIALSRTD
jgi:hypothetical protein